MLRQGQQVIKIISGSNYCTRNWRISSN